MVQRKVFAGETRAEAKNAADEWWAKQTGLERIGDFATTVGDHLAPPNGLRWTAIIIYRKASRSPGREGH